MNFVSLWTVRCSESKGGLGRVPFSLSSHTLLRGEGELFPSMHCTPITACSASFQAALTTYFSNAFRLACSLPPYDTPCSNKGDPLKMVKRYWEESSLTGLHQCFPSLLQFPLFSFDVSKTNKSFLARLIHKLARITFLNITVLLW